jgi:hypothetical protein
VGIERGALTDEDITQCSQTLPELLNLGLVRLGLVAILVLGATLLLDVKSQVLEQHDLAVARLGDNGLDLGAYTVRRELDALAQELLELGNDGLQGVLGVGGTVGTAEMRHEDHSLGTIVDGILDGRDGAGDTLVVGNVLVGIEGNVEVDLAVMLGDISKRKRRTTRELATDTLKVVPRDTAMEMYCV